MSKRVVVIDNCDQCPHFDNEYYSYNETCMELKRINPYPYNIPDDCPLKILGEE